MNLKSNAIDMTGAGYRGIHPAVVLCSWLMMLVTLHFIGMLQLVILAGIFTLAAFVMSAGQFMVLLRRTRWLLLSIAIIYAYAGGGEAIWPQLGMFSPHMQGIAAGVMQMLRLLVVLSSLAVLLERLKITGILLALHAMSRPLAILGIQVERGLVRLALTLDYVEREKSTSVTGWRELLGVNMQTRSEPAVQMQLLRVPLGISDWLVLGVITLSLGWLLW